MGWRNFPLYGFPVSSMLNLDKMRPCPQFGDVHSNRTHKLAIRSPIAKVPDTAVLIVLSKLIDVAQYHKTPCSRADRRCHASIRYRYSARVRARISEKLFSHPHEVMYFRSKFDFFTFVQIFAVLGRCVQVP